MTEECKCCPFSKCPFDCALNDESSRRVQEIIYWRRPIKSLVVLAVVDVFMILLYFLNTGFFATVILLGCLNFLLKFVWAKFGEQISSFLFSPPLDDSAAADRTDRIRSVDEVKSFTKKYHDYVKTAVDWVRNYKQNPDFNSHLIFFGSAFVAFFVATLFGTWLLCFLAINAFFIVPACLLNSELHQFVQSKMNKAKAE